MFIGCSLENYAQWNDRYELLYYEKLLSIKYPFRLRKNLTNKNSYKIIIQEQFVWTSERICKTTNLIVPLTFQQTTAAS